jgi:hypothetical protein
MRLPTLLLLSCCGPVFGAAWAGEEPARVEIKLAHKGQVFGEGPEWDKQYAREALQIFNDLKPDPAWVAKLKGLPDNTWLRCDPKGDQVAPTSRSEAPMVYLPDFHACMFHGGCGDPGYSSDTWVYHTGANRWVQMWPNFVKCAEAPKLNKEPYPGDRPGTRCSLGLAYDSDRKLVVQRGGANAGDAGRATWTWNPATNVWTTEVGKETGYSASEANCLGFAPGLGAVEIGGDFKAKAAPTWVYRSATKKWGTVATQGSPPGALCSKLVWASKPERLIFWNGALWAFDPKGLAWEDLSPKEGANPAGFYRQGIDYDSANDVIVMFGTKDESDKLSQGPWIYSFEKKTWTDTKPANGPWKGSGQSMFAAYDSEYNVLVIAGSGRGTWAYRYKQAPARADGK